MSRPLGSPARHHDFDYTAVGHVTVDVLADGSRRPGGGAFYSGLQAARLGRRTLVITRGVPEEIEELVSPFADELSLRVIPARCTTTLETVGGDAKPVRSQRLVAWAGPIGVPEVRDTNVLHLAPVARETSPRWEGRAAFVGLTAQGLVRAWAHEGAMLERRALEANEVPERCDAVVVSEDERASAAALERGLHALIAVTRAAGPTLVAAPGARSFEVPVPAHDAVLDDVGAGDVFAAALFSTLAEGQAAQEAVAVAHAAAAVRISGEGPAAVGDALAIERRLLALG